MKEWNLYRFEEQTNILNWSWTEMLVKISVPHWICSFHVAYYLRLTLKSFSPSNFTSRTHFFQCINLLVMCSTGCNVSSRTSKQHEFNLPASVFWTYNFNKVCIRQIFKSFCWCTALTLPVRLKGKQLSYQTQTEDRHLASYHVMSSMHFYSTFKNALLLIITLYFYATNLLYWWYVTL